LGIGDELMVSGRARVMQQSDPRKCRVIFKRAPKWSPIWDNNPRIARLDEQGDFQVLFAKDPKTNLRPYHTAKGEDRWTYNLDFRPDVGEIYFSEEERKLAHRPRYGDAANGDWILIEPHIKPGASPNKQWGRERWQALARLLRKAGLQAAQVGPPGTPRLEGVDLIETMNFRLAAAVLAGARAAVLPEGGLHHAAAALGVPGVVIFGGFTPVELTGYAMHRNLGASLGEACGMRTPCAHCAAAMAAITPEQVFNELKGGVLNA
jgi:ADP-heptose:LPS heptosyltransferase